MEFCEVWCTMVQEKELYGVAVQVEVQGVRVEV